MNRRLKQAREYLKLSQEFVTGQMGLPCDETRAIEDGRREVNAEEIEFFSKAVWRDRKI